ncbi:hypothetical protein MN116_002694, partial [Schistosoma mekongi]
NLINYQMYSKHFNKSPIHLNTYNVYTEARSLLNEWIVKNMLDIEDINGEINEFVPLTPDRKEIKREWDHLLKNNSSKNNFTDDYDAEDLLKDSHRLEYDDRNTYSCHSDYSRKRKSTLEKILLRQEEAKARRELRQKELESRLIREATERHMKAQILYKAKQADSNPVDCIQSTVCKLDVKSVSENSTDEFDSFPSTVNIRSMQIRNEKHLMKSTFNGWYNLIYNMKILSTILQVKIEFHIKKSYFIYWKLQLHQIIVNHDIDKAKLQSIELVKKEYNAKQFYETSLVKRCFSSWQRNIQMQKSTRNQLDKESLRHEKEIEFLNNLEIFLNNNQMKTFTNDDNNDEIVKSVNCKCLNDRKLQKLQTTSSGKLNLKSKNSSHSVIDLKADNFTVDPSKSNGKINHRVVTRPDSMKSYLNQTVLLQQQHNIIIEQKQQIHELKRAHRYTEWLLEVRTYELSKNNLQNTITKNKTIDKFSESTESLLRIENDTNVHNHSLKIPNETNNSVKDNQSMTDSRLGSIPSKNSPIVRKNSFVQKMEERAAERARRHALQEERKRENEQKKKEQLAKQLEEEAYRIKQEKRMLINAQKEKKIREEELRQQKELRLAYQRELNTKVTIHRNISCLRYYGLKPWLKYVIKQHELIDMVKCYQNNAIMRNAFHTWSLVVQIKYEQENKFIQHHYNLFLIKRIINAFKKACKESNEKAVYANTWYCQQLLYRSFTRWIQYITELCIQQWQQDETAVEHYKRHLLNVHFKIWTHFPCIQRNHREREYRREQFRKCLLDIIPDFNPPKYDDNEID